MTDPLIFQPSFERVAPDEAETSAALVAQMRRITETTFKDYGHAVRSVHAKSHVILRAELTVLDDLPPALAQGAFARPGGFPVVMRFSTNPGDLLDDSVSAPRGLAVKIVGVEGARLPGAEDQVTQDFVMANAPAFSAADPKAFLSTVKLLASTTDVAQGAKKVLSSVARAAEAALETVGGKSATLLGLGGQPLTQILGESFYTQVPVLYGPYVAKLAVIPVSQGLTGLTDMPVEVAGRPNALREDAESFMAETGGVWEVRVQLCTDLDKMPIEDASVPWPEDVSPYVTVARIGAPAQAAWSEARSEAVDDGLAFSPWHGLAAHRPLGGIMRARKPAYEMSAGFRAEHNGCPIHEPRGLDAFPV